MGWINYLHTLLEVFYLIVSEMIYLAAKGLTYDNVNLLCMHKDKLKIPYISQPLN